MSIMNLLSMGMKYRYAFRGFYFDWTYILALAGLGIALLAQANVRSTFAKYARVPSATGMTGAAAARAVLESFGIAGVSIEPVSGSLTDHYDPRTRTLRLSESTYSSASVAAICVAAHECGHAKQHAENYGLLALRSALVPAASFGSSLAWPVFIAGLIFSLRFLTTAGIILFSLAVLFQLITLPVEFDASARALKLLQETRLLPENELQQGRAVLRAAALTYVAALAQSVLQLLRLIILSRSRRD